MSDLKPFEHGQEGTHHACQEMIEKYGGKTQCCGCTGHKCNPNPTEKRECDHYCHGKDVGVDIQDIPYCIHCDPKEKCKCLIHKFEHEFRLHGRLCIGVGCICNPPSATTVESWENSQTCKHCGKEKPLADFIKEKDTIKGRAYECYECYRLRDARRYYSNRPKRLLKDKKRFEDPSTKEKMTKKQIIELAQWLWRINFYGSTQPKKR